MKHRITAVASLAMALFVGSTWADDALRSGPQVGDAVPRPFNPANVTGKFAGTKQCLV